jgi:hypothetical protein
MRCAGEAHERPLSNEVTAGSVLGKLPLLSSTLYSSTVAHFWKQLSCFHQSTPPKSVDAKCSTEYWGQ